MNFKDKTQKIVDATLGYGSEMWEYRIALALKEAFEEGAKSMRDRAADTIEQSEPPRLIMLGNGCNREVRSHDMIRYTADLVREVPIIQEKTE